MSQPTDQDRSTLQAMATASLHHTRSAEAVRAAGLIELPFAIGLTSQSR